MMFLGWITTGQRTPPPLLKAAEVANTEQVAQAQGDAHHLPNPKGHERLRQVAQGLRLRYDARLTTNLVGLLGAHPTVYAGAQKDADELRDQLRWRDLSERLLSTFRSLTGRALFGGVLREAYVAQRSDGVAETIQALHEAAQAAGAVSPDLAAVHAGVWPVFERLNQRSKSGVSDAAAQRSTGEEEGRDWRAYALALTERLEVIEAGLQKQAEKTAESHVATHKAPPRAEDDRQARR